MCRLSPLPERLRYLQPFRKQVGKLKPEEIDESMDLSLLNDLLLERIKRTRTEEGKRTLEADNEVLEKWLALPGLEDNGGMIFLRGYLMALPELVDRLLEEKQKPQERFQIQMEFPEGAKVKKQQWGWKVNWLRATLFVTPLEAKLVEIETRMLRETTPHRLAKLTMASVIFGSARGVKRVMHIPDVGSYSVDYVLTVPGGFAQIGLLGPTTPLPFDETKFEKYFHTVRVARV